MLKLQLASKTESKQETIYVYTCAPEDLPKQEGTQEAFVHLYLYTNVQNPEGGSLAKQEAMRKP